jgi:hypothetical protein
VVASFRLTHLPAQLFIPEMEARAFMQIKLQFNTLCFRTSVSSSALLCVGIGIGAYVCVCGWTSTTPSPTVRSSFRHV